MTAYIARRVLQSAVILLILLLLVFLVVEQVGDPARLMLPTEAPEEMYLALREQLGLNDPFHERLLRTMGGWLRGDFGTSLWQGVPALPLALSRVPATALLTFATLVIAIPVAVVVGTLSAVKPRSIWDRLLTVLSLAGVSVAEFWLALMLILVLAVQLHWFPTSGYGGLQYLVLPVIALAFRPIGRIAQVARSALAEQADKPYFNALRAKGLTEWRIVRRHGLKNAAIPIVTVAGDELAVFLNGAVVIEMIFAWPGIGTLFIEAINRRDLPLIEACVVVVAVMVMATNLLVDLTYAYLDPRARLHGRDD